MNPYNELTYTSESLIKVISIIAKVRSIVDVWRITAGKIELTLANPVLTSQDLTKVNQAISQFNLQLRAVDLKGEYELYRAKSVKSVKSDK